jgi:hypothetical protein
MGNSMNFYKAYRRTGEFLHRPRGVPRIPLDISSGFMADFEFILYVPRPCRVIFEGKVVK